MGDKGHFVQIRGGVAVILPAAGHGAVIVAAAGVVVVQRALGGRRQLKLDIAEAGTGDLLALTVEVRIVKGDFTTLISRIADAAAVVGFHHNGDGAAELVALGIPGPERNIDRAGIGVGCRKGYTAQIRRTVIIVIAVGGDLVTVAAGTAGIVIVEFALAGGRQGEADVIQGVARGTAAQAVEVAFIHGDPSALGDGVVDITIAGGFGNLDAHTAAERCAVDVSGQEGQHHFTAVSVAGHKVDIIQGRGAVELVLLGRLHRGIVGSAGGVAVIECSPAAVGQGEGDAGQIAAGAAAAEAVEVIGVELQRLIGCNRIGDVLHLGHRDLNGTLEEGRCIGIAGVGDDGCTAEIRLGDKGHITETPLGQGGIDIIHLTGTDARAGVRVGLVAVVQRSLLGGDGEAAHMAQGAAQHIAALTLDAAHQARERYRLAGIHRYSNGIGGVAFHLDLTGGGVSAAADFGRDGGSALLETIQIAVLHGHHSGIAAGPLNFLLLQGGTEHLIL